MGAWQLRLHTRRRRPHHERSDGRQPILRRGRRRRPVRTDRLRTLGQVGLESIQRAGREPHPDPPYQPARDGELLMPMDPTRIDAWLAAAVADAKRRGLPELEPLLETMARSTAALRSADDSVRLKAQASRLEENREH